MSSDKDNNSLKTLLDYLQTLFSRVSALNLNRRMMSHRKSDSALLDQQILAALYEIVEKTPVPNDSKNRESTVVYEPQTVVVKSDISNLDVTTKKGDITSSSASNKDLSNRLHATLSRTSDAIYVGEKLSVSAWDHIRASLRYVREKNAGLAKMHADLASEALQQASHYMADEEYIVLKASVLEELQKLHEQPIDE